MNNIMIEVDPKLFATCRLCLDEMGLYQIVPKVQMQIKYCFEIDVQPFDGLPQLICKKCESILSQYAGIKQMYQEKQNSLKTVKKSAQEKPEEKIEELKENSVQQQDTVSSTQQVESVNASSSSAKKTNKYKLSLTKRVRSSDRESSISKSNDYFTPIKPTTSKNRVKSKPKKERLAWASNYTRQFVCRFCSKSCSEKRYIILHMNKHEDIIMKYTNILNSHCEVRLNKVGSTLNITNSAENVVLSENKIINSVNSKYYIVYSSNSKKEDSSPESSDEELIRSAGKYKRRRLISEDSMNSEKDSSQTSIGIEKQFQDSKRIECDQKTDTFIDCVNVDSDSTSTQTNVTKISDTEKPQQKLMGVNKKLISNIITMCYKQYIKRLDSSRGSSKLHGNMDSFLKHKLLSIGTKVIHSRGLNSMGLLRYLEHNNLDVTWTQSKNSNSSIIVQTSLVNTKSTDTDINDLGWKPFNEMNEDHITQDFVDIFEKLSAQESSPRLEDRELIEVPSRLNSNENNIEIKISTNKSPITSNENNKKQEKQITDSNNPIQITSEVPEPSEDAVLLLHTYKEADKQTCKKILNANPVPYPKQLLTKKISAHESSLKSPTHPPVSMEAPRLESSFVNYDSDVAHMPVITSTVSLAPLAEDHKQKQSSSTTAQVASTNKSEAGVPQIKVKPISELMPDRSVQNNAALVNRGGWTVTSANKNEGMVLHSKNPNLVYIANMPQYRNVAPHQSAPPLRYPQVLQATTSRQTGSNDRVRRKNQEYVHMHTVELPNNKTTSPFRYFQRLLQVHNLVLLESTASISYISSTMKCIIKFSLGFQQENNAPVTLCLTLFCDKNVFCIKVKDSTSKDIDVSKLSPNWQWEILKVFKGDIVTKLNLNALKHGLDMSSKVNHFVSLLKAIVFSKEK